MPEKKPKKTTSKCPTRPAKTDRVGFGRKTRSRKNGGFNTEEKRESTKEGRPGLGCKGTKEERSFGVTEEKEKRKTPSREC